MMKVHSNIARAVGVASVLRQLASLESHQVESWSAYGQAVDGRRHRSLFGEVVVRRLLDVPKRATWSQSRINPKFCTTTQQRRIAMDLFEDDDDDDESNAASSIHQEERERRPKENGVLQFHEGTEDALLIYVHNRVQQQEDPCRLPVQPASAESVLQSIDAFCLDRYVRTRHRPVEKRICFPCFPTHTLCCAIPFILIIMIQKQHQTGIG
jgi:hypothetical protein